MAPVLEARKTRDMSPAPRAVKDCKDVKESKENEVPIAAKEKQTQEQKSTPKAPAEERVPARSRVAEACASARSRMSCIFTMRIMVGVLLVLTIVALAACAYMHPIQLEERVNASKEMAGKVADAVARASQELRELAVKAVASQAGDAAEPVSEPVAPADAGEL
eukprot:gb/GFBE01050489.1/.p1 GENE.gb/GFBE01050489.1/~~gb/GFBE01050489.1/.p1  ORF type:complete len:164 (+),score=51.41 gb/GFBE01050489.1/:1-492(+)